MGYQVYDVKMVCSKCGFPVAQMYRELHDKDHKMIIEGDIKVCKVKGEHLHVECCCGHPGILRPLDWKSDVKPKSRKSTKKKPASRRVRKS